MTGNKNCLRCGYPAENSQHDDCCPDGVEHAYPTRESNAERQECAYLARNYEPAVDGKMAERDMKIVRETRECIANQILARGNPPAKAEISPPKRLGIGTRVQIAVDPQRVARYWNVGTDMFRSRKTTGKGSVANSSNPIYGLYYDVVHDEDGTAACYEPHELTELHEKVPNCSHCDDRRFVASGNDDLVHNRRSKPCPVCNVNAVYKEPKDRELCPDCGRPKAQDIKDCSRGDCPKWYAIMDQAAEDDCRRVANRRPAPARPTVSEPWQQRVYEEAAQLRDRLHKLREFLNTPKFGELPDPERERLTRQLVLMDGYNEVLRERIAANFKSPKKLDPETWLDEHGFLYGRRDCSILRTRMPEGLLARMSRWKGDFIVFDPSDDVDGFCIVGKDLPKLQQEAFEHLYEEPEEQAKPSAADKCCEVRIVEVDYHGVRKSMDVRGLDGEFFMTPEQVGERVTSAIHTMKQRPNATSLGDNSRADYIEVRVHWNIQPRNQA